MKHTIPASRAGASAALLLMLLSSSASLAKEVTHRYFRFTPVLLRGAANSVQLAEFEFLHLGAPLDLTGVIVTNPGGDNPPAGPPDPPAGGGENPEKIIDLDTGTKWLDFNQTMPLVFDFPVPVTIDEYNFATANDAPERDPVSWTFEGSDDGTTWTLLDAVNGYPTTTVRFAYEAGFAIPETTPPVITAFGIAPVVILNGSTTDLVWTSANGTTAAIDPAVGPVPTSGTQTVSPPDDADTTYTLTVTNAVATVNAQATVRTVAGGVSNYQYFRFSPIKLRGNGGENSIQLAEFEFLNAGTPLDLTGVIVTNPGGDNPPAGPPDPPVGGGENPEFVIDGDVNTKWLDFTKFSGLEFDFGAPVAIDGYRFITANDSPDRDPVRWLMEGSNDGFEWALIENMTAFDYPVPTARFTATPDIPLPGSSLLPYVQVIFYADQPTAIAGEEVVLYWEVSGFFDSLEIDNGIGVVGDLGEQAVRPAASTTYTLSASLGDGRPAKVELPVTIVTPAITDICYADFSAAGEELSLLGSAEVVNAFATIPLPGDVPRLRLTDDIGGQSGTVWFRKRFDFSQGFDTSFDLHFVTAGLDPNTGADGISFIIQNNTTGTATQPTTPNEDGLPTDALNIKFDSYMNAGDLSSAVIQVRDWATVVAEADLSTNPALTLGGPNPLDMTQDSADAPYRVRVTYVPGDLDVYFNGVPVIADVDINLDTILAVDAAGKGFVGFSARTGGSFEAHDITRWCLTEGPPAPAVPIDILASSFDFDTDTVTLTFTSADTRSYRVTSSTNGINFSNVVAGGIAGAAGAAATSTTVSFTQVPFLLLRVEQE